jgi:preprotein translocase subunit SecG
MLHALLMIVHFFCAAGIVALVLLQRGKGAEAGAGFGSGASGTVFGARGATTALSRATAVLAGVFMITSLSLAYVGSKASTTSNSLLDRLSQQNAPAAPKRLPRGALPGPVPFGAPAGAGQTPPAAAQSTAPVAPSTGPAPAPSGAAGNTMQNGAAPAHAPASGPGSSSAPSGNTGGANSSGGAGGAPH